MSLSRRGFLAGAATLPMMTNKVAAKTLAPPRVLTAAPTRLQIAPPDYPETEVWAFDGQVPGQALRYQQGDEVQVRLQNALTQPTTVHWHGLRLPNAMDGVPGMTQAAVASGESFDYRFVARDAGTFWYHPHANSTEQISRGLAGVLVVDEADRPDVDADEVIVLDDWRMTEEAQISASFGDWHDLSHGGRLGNYITANGRPELRLEAAPGDRLRLRLVNTATARTFRLRVSGLRIWVAALDGMPLEDLQEVSEVVIAPAQRVDLFADVTAGAGEEAIIGSVERDGTYATTVIAVTGTGGGGRAAPVPLMPNQMPEVQIGDARSVALKMEGGAMRGLPDGAVWQGTKMEMRELAEMGQFWAFNGLAGMTDDPLVQAALGETVRIPITNATAFPHAMHLHGTHFREVLPDGALGPWRDTLLVMPDERREIAFVAENPGDWTFHCHMLSHQQSGMMNWIRVS